MCALLRLNTKQVPHTDPIFRCRWRHSCISTDFTILPKFSQPNNRQMSEEIQNAALVVPRSIMTSIFINGALGFSVLVVLLFSLNDVEKALKSPTAYPYMQIFLDSTGSVAGATAMASIIGVIAFSANIAILATASRMCWSFCRDRGLPGWQLLQHVRDPFKIPSKFVTIWNQHTKV